MSVVHRVEVRPRSGHRDPRGEGVLRQAAALGGPVPQRVEHAAVYLLEGELDLGAPGVEKDGEKAEETDAAYSKTNDPVRARVVWLRPSQEAGLPKATRSAAIPGAQHAAIPGGLIAA